MKTLKRFDSEFWVVIDKIHFRLQNQKKTDLGIYDMIEENRYKNKSRREKKTMNKQSNNTLTSSKVPSRNVIKKIKARTIKLFSRIFNEKRLNTRMKVRSKKTLKQIFKTDISKARNRILMKTKLRDIFEKFTTLNLNEQKPILEKYHEIIKFMLNCTWESFLNHIKYGNEEIVDLFHSLLNDSEQIECNEVRHYINYIKSNKGRENVKEVLDQKYLEIYDYINKNNNKQEEMHVPSEDFCEQLRIYLSNNNHKGNN